MGCTNIRVASVSIEQLMQFPAGTEILDIQREDDHTYVFTVAGPEVPNTAECRALLRTQPALVMTLEPVAT